MLFNSYSYEILYEQFHWIYLQGDIKLLLVIVNNRLKFEIEIVHDLSCQPIVDTCPLTKFYLKAVCNHCTILKMMYPAGWKPQWLQRCEMKWSGCNSCIMYCCVYVCQTPLTVQHFMLYCPQLTVKRTKYFTVSSLKRLVLPCQSSCDCWFYHRYWIFTNIYDSIHPHL